MITAKWIFPVCTVSSRVCWLSCHEPNDNHGLQFSSILRVVCALKTEIYVLVFYCFATYYHTLGSLKHSFSMFLYVKSSQQGSIGVLCLGSSKAKIKVWVQLDSYFNWEGLILTLYWIRFCDFNFYFAAFVIMGIHNGLLQGDLPASLFLTIGL